jgi:hypothetical protein
MEEIVGGATYVIVAVAVPAGVKKDTVASPAVRAVVVLAVNSAWLTDASSVGVTPPTVIPMYEPFNAAP